MSEQTMTTKEIYQADLHGEVPFETVERSACETLARYRGTSESSEDIEDR